MSRRRVRSRRPSSISNLSSGRPSNNSPARRKTAGNIALIICAVLLAFFVIASNASKHKVSAAQPETNELVRNDMPLPNRDAPEGAILVDMTGNGYDLEQIILAIPDAEARGTIHEHIGTGRIGLAWVEDMNVGAEFRLTLVPTGERLPTLVFPSNFTTEARRDTLTWARAQLTIYHEFVHFLQWRDKGYPAETFMPDRMSIGRDACTKKWYAEKDAYHRECEFARETGLLEQLDPNEGLSTICGTTDDEGAFDARLRTLLPRGDVSATVCTPYWRDLR